jgi:MFS family permease
VRFEPLAYIRGLAAERELVKYVLAASAFWLGTGGVLPYLTRFGVHVLGVSEGTAFQLFLPALVGTIVGSVPAGYAADRIGKLPVLATGVLAFSIIAFVSSQVGTFEQALLAMGVIGLANGVWTSLAVPLLIDLTPPERAAEARASGPSRSRSAR